MDPSEFLGVAEELLDGDHQGHWRSAVSRAYYAAFHTCCRLFRRCGFVVPDSDRSRAYCWLRMTQAGHPDVQQAGSDLADLRRLRIQADYELERAFRHRLAVDAWTLAASVLRVLHETTGLPHVLSQITQKMRDYEQQIQDITWQGPPA